jgi:plasmid stabilization system protein ParE
MKHEVEFRKEAQHDILEAIKWYENSREGLGDDFFIAIENEKHFIEQNPFHYEDKYKGVRKSIVKRFPYIIYYKVYTRNKVLVLAVLHMKRSSRLWKGRIK